MHCLYTRNTNFQTSGILFKVAAPDTYKEECLKAKKMLETFSNFASIKNVKKYKAEITTYISLIKKFKGFWVMVHSLSPYDSCSRDVKVNSIRSKDADISEARTGLSPTLMECETFLPKPLRSEWKVLKRKIASKAAKKGLLQRVPSYLKGSGCFGRMGDLCILKNLQTGRTCSLECKWHGQYDLVHMDQAQFFQGCSRIAKELPVFKKTRFGTYSHICNSSYPALNSNITYRCIEDAKSGYHVYRQQTELELGRHSSNIMPLTLQ